MLFEIYLGYAKQFYGMFIFFIRGDYFRFGSVFIYIKKVTKLKFKKKTETGSNRPVSVRFGFLGQKPVQTSLTWFFWFGSVFFRFGSVFFQFFRFEFGSVFSVSGL
jgi:hypothetical protein